ncbi:MAG: RNA polymerase sigma factor [Gemmataceae bacterium]
MDARHLGEWLDRLGPALVLYARQWCSAPEDAVQEAFVRLAAASPANVPAWLHRVVRNAALSAGRAERRRRRHETAAARPAFRPSDDLDAEAVGQALEGLPADLREPLVAHLWGGLTFADIAALVGTSPATAHRRYAEALDLLRERLGER